MRLAHELLNLRRVLVFCIVASAITANILPNGVVIAVTAWLCFLLLVMVYLFDITYHGVEGSKVSTAVLFATLVRPLRNKRLDGCLGVRQTFRLLSRYLIPEGTSTIRYNGFGFDVDNRSYPELLVWDGSRHLPNVMKTFEGMIEGGMTVLDLGAAMGWYTLPAARIVGPKGKVYAFEPFPKAFELLRRNVARSGFGNVTLSNMAVSNILGPAKLYLSKREPLANSLGTGRTGCSFIEVTTITLDEFLDSTKVDVIKMNIEGAEPLALRGMTEVIKNSPNLKVIAEFDPNALKGLGLSEEQYIDILLENFDLQVISTKRAVLIPFEDVEQLRKELTHKGGTAYLACRRRN